jgi:hypothetical protein
LLLSGLLSRLLLRHIIQCRHYGTFLAEHRSACQAGNTVKSTVPFVNQVEARDYVVTAMVRMSTWALWNTMPAPLT